MPQRDPVRPEFVRYLRTLAGTGVPHAEAWRRLIPLAARLGVPRPSYPSVRRVLLREARDVHDRRRAREQFMADWFAGRVPRTWP